MSRWFRFYDDAINDPKVLRLSDKMFRAWVGILCMASKYNGAVPKADMAISLRVPENGVKAIIAYLVDHNLLEDRGDVVTPHNWDGRQYKSDTKTDAGGKKDSYVYVIGTVWGAPALKIGFSKNPWARIVELQTAQSEKLEVLATFKCRSHSEVDIHDILKPYRKQGEWFALPVRVYAAISDAASRSVSYDALVVELRKLLRPTTTDTEAETEQKIDSAGASVHAEFLKLAKSDHDDPSLFGSLYGIQGMLSRGFSRETILAGAANAMRGKARPPNWNYFAKCIESENEQRASPAKPEIHRGATENLAQTAKRLAGEVIGFGPRPSIYGSAEDGNIVRVLSDRSGERP